MNLASKYIERLKEVLGVTRDEDLADKVGVAKSTVATWRRRGSIPDASIAQLEAKTGLSYSDIRTEFYSSGAAIRLLARMAFYKTVTKLIVNAADQDRGVLAINLAVQADHIIDLIAERMAASLPAELAEQDIVKLAARVDLKADRYVSEDEVQRLLNEGSTDK